jgi:signal transduction histidine kinase
VVVWRGAALEPVPALGRHSCSAVYADNRGRQWVGFTSGGVAVVDAAGAVERHDEAEGTTGGVLAIHGDRSGAVWVITRSGLNRYQDGRVVTLTQNNGPFANLLASLLEDDEGYLWVTANAGAAAVRFSPREVDRVAADPRHRIEYASYDASDGLLGDVHWQQSRSLAARAADGRLWFATGIGVAVFNPRNLPMNVRAAVPRIDQVYDDGRELPSAAGAGPPPAITNLTVSWTSVSLSDASKVSYRYRLEGHDADWTFAGSRRSASFSKLPPGQYRLRVSATNDGTWTEAALFDFVVPPPFYRTSWFVAAALLLVSAVVASAWQLRLRGVRGQHALVMSERARVSREIHDTLLQNLAAIGMELDTIGRELSPREVGGRDAVRRLQRQVGHSLREARDLVVALRQNGTFKSRGGLADAVRDLADNAASTRGARISVDVNGLSERQCDPDVELQLLRICQEAINNALRHGRATEIQIVIDAMPRELALTVTDNGAGFATNGGPSGHDAEQLGLLGMHERAERVGGRLTITSAPGAGTTISAIVPVEMR